MTTDLMGRTIGETEGHPGKGDPFAIERGWGGDCSQLSLRLSIILYIGREKRKEGSSWIRQ